MAVFQGCQVVLDLSTAVKFKEKQTLRKLITDNAGVVSFIVTKKSTHVVCDNGEKADTSYKCRMAVKYGIPVISSMFLWKSVEAGILQKTDDFIVAGKSKSDTLKEGKITASRYQKTDKKKAVRPFINVNGIKVWHGSDNDCPSFTSDYQVAKFSVFRNQKKEKSRTITSFAVIEVHVDENYILKHDPDLRYKYRVSTHSGLLHVVEKGGEGKIEYRFCSSVDEALTVYSYLYNLQLQKGMELMHNVFSRLIGSEKFKQMMSELGLENTKITESVQELILHMWCEAQGELYDTVSSRDTTLEQVDKAEAILKQLKSALDDGDSTKMNKLMTEFYSTIPHHPSKRDMTCSKKWLSRSQDLCQLIRDMLTVSEATDWSTSSSVQSKYKALRCVIEDVSQTSLEYQTVEDMVTQSITGNTKPAIKNIFTVNRPVENVAFTSQMPNKQFLFHSTKAENLVGILSRGLLLPRVVVDDHGGKRTDPGMLGAGIYFADTASTSIQYSHPSDTKGTRFMLVNEVALGKTMEMYAKDLTLTSAPEGYQSVHGVKSSSETASAFKDDEYVVYNTNQQRIKYLVEFVLPDDKIKDNLDYLNMSRFTDVQSEEENMDDIDINLSDVTNVTDPMTKVKPGLVSKNDAPVNLKAVHIRAKLLDLASEVVVLQEYENTSKAPLEAKYVFPLGDLAAVCGFEAFINGKHIVGEVKEKEKAHKEYKKAISEGHGAYLMDQDEETPDIFTVSVGNLPPGACVLIKITYVAELQVEGEMINFQLPGSVAPWKKQSLKEVTQHETETHEVQQGETSLQLAVDMPFDIRTIECPSHKIKVKKTLTKATVEMLENQSIADGFQLLIGLAEIHVPRMWVERKEGDQLHQACMLSFYPEFEACETDDVDVVLLLDMSNSMKGDNLNNSKKIALLTLQQLPPSWNFNVVVFGTAFKEVFPGCVKKTPANMKSANQFIMNLTATMGNTEVVRPMHTFYLLKPESMVQNVFLISDGHINNEETMMKQALDNFHHTRIFTLGVGTTANRHLLRALARVAGGSFEFFDQKAKSKWERKIKSHINKAAQPGLTSVSVDWEQHGADVPVPVQAPTQITALFSGSRQVVYGFVPNCTMATLHANIAGEEVSTLVSTSDLSITTGKILHRLTAKAVISDWEDGVLSPDKTDHEVVKMNTKDYIIELSKEYSIVTQFTSFVAIEKRDKDDEKAALDAPSMSELVEKESVDELVYMGYEEAEKSDLDTNKSIEEVLINVRLNFDSKDKQLEFLREGFRLIEQIPDEDESSQKKTRLEDAFFDWDLSEQFDFTQEFGYKPKRLLVTLIIKTLTGRYLTISADPTSTVSQIKTMIRENEGKPEDAQRLIFDGRQAEDSKTLQDLDIQDTSKIFLLERLRGGGSGPAMTEAEEKKRASSGDECIEAGGLTFLADESMEDSEESTDVDSSDFEDDSEASSDFDGEDGEDEGEYIEDESSEECEEEDHEGKGFLRSSPMSFVEDSKVQSAPFEAKEASFDIMEQMEKYDRSEEREKFSLRTFSRRRELPELAHAFSRRSGPVAERIEIPSEDSTESDVSDGVDDVYLACEISEAISYPASALKPSDGDWDTEDSELEAELDELMQETLDCQVLQENVEGGAGVSMDVHVDEMIIHNAKPRQYARSMLMSEEEESEDDMAFGLFDDDYEMPGESYREKSSNEVLVEKKVIPEVIQLDAKAVVAETALKRKKMEFSAYLPVLQADKQFIETPEIIARSIDCVLDRGEKMDELLEKSQELSAEASVFKKATSLSENFEKKKKKKSMLSKIDDVQGKSVPPPPPPAPPGGSSAFGRATVMQQAPIVCTSFSYRSGPSKDLLGGPPAAPPVPFGNFRFGGSLGIAPPPPAPPMFGFGPVSGGSPQAPSGGSLFGRAPSRPDPFPLESSNDEPLVSRGAGFSFGGSAPLTLGGMGAPAQPPSVTPFSFGGISNDIRPLVFEMPQTQQNIQQASVSIIAGDVPKPPPLPPRSRPPFSTSAPAQKRASFTVPSPPPPPSRPPPPATGKVHGGIALEHDLICTEESLREDTSTTFSVSTPTDIFGKGKPRFTDTREVNPPAPFLKEPTCAFSSTQRYSESPPLKKGEARKPVSWRSVGLTDKGYEGSVPSRRGALLSGIKQGKQLKKTKSKVLEEAPGSKVMFASLSKRIQREDPDTQTPLLDDFLSLVPKPLAHSSHIKSGVELSTYGIGVDIPYICTGTLDQSKKEEFLSWLLSSQSKDGFWEVYPCSQLEVTLKVDMAVVEQVLKRAGLSSLGESVRRDITRLVSSIIVVLSILKICLPDRVPMDFNDQSVSEKVLTNLLDAVEYQGAQYTQMVKKAFKFGEEVDKRRPLVCNSLELGSNWILVVGKMMGLHKEEPNISEMTPSTYDRAVMEIEVI